MGGGVSWAHGYFAQSVAWVPGPGGSKVFRCSEKLARVPTPGVLAKVSGGGGGGMRVNDRISWSRGFKGFTESSHRLSWLNLLPPIFAHEWVRCRRSRRCGGRRRAGRHTLRQAHPRQGRAARTRARGGGAVCASVALCVAPPSPPRTGQLAPRPHSDTHHRSPRAARPCARPRAPQRPPPPPSAAHAPPLGAPRF